MERQENTVTFGHSNSGTQVGQNFGTITEVHQPRPDPETPPLPSSNVPFPRDVDFVERRGLLDRLQEKISRPGARVALAGLGGVGKSQLSIEYSYRLRARSPNTWVFWIHASDAVQFEQSIRDIADLVKLKGRKAQDATLLQLLRNWLRDASKGPWLIVLDNADDASFLISESSAESGLTSTSPYGYLPACDHGSILITTRTKDAAVQLIDDRDIIDVQPMDEGEALVLLTNKMGDHAYRSELQELARTVDFMPLAMTQAAAYIRRRGRRCSVRQYLEKLLESDLSMMDLLDHDEGDLRRVRAAENSVMLTWQVSFTYILEQRRSAADLLSLMSLCDRQAIPESLLRCPRKRDDPVDSDAFEADIEMLLGFSFISVAESGTDFQMHRLVQLSTRTWLDSRGGLNSAVEELIGKLHVAFPRKDVENWGVCETLFPHARSALGLVPQSRHGVKYWGSVMSKAAAYAHFRGGAVLWAQTRQMRERCWRVQKERLGDDHPATLTAMSDLASYYINRLECGDEGAEMAQRCWEMTKQKLGMDHPATLLAMSNLAASYNREEDYRKAAGLEEQCWALRKEKLGETHYRTLSSMGNLALYYSNLGDNGKAVELGEQCWAMRKEKLGEGHRHTLTSMEDLVTYYADLGETLKASEMGERCWKIHKERLGQDHPRTLRSMANLAVYWYRLNRRMSAIQLLEQCVQASISKLGEHHPHTVLRTSGLHAWRSSQDVDSG